MAFEGCSSDRQEEIRKAVVIAASRVKSALSYLKKLDSNEPRYLKWFGEWELKWWNWVKEVFGHIEDSFQKHYILYDCHTGTETFLYARVVAVDRKKPVRMYLCPPFWDLPLDGLMSKVSVLIHESSHWDIHGGTRHPGLTRDDITRDPESGIIALAKSNPQEAIHNAYTYQFFAVDKPNLP
ncbi:hypothetical protein F5887DRAFT_1073486 [Amanita rubescens]|nr:hypothetical protein F5887DRAFT_1073486 [Amanita rubescens]